MLTVESIKQQLKIDRIYGTGDQRRTHTSSKNIPEEFKITPRSKGKNEEKQVPVGKTPIGSIPAMRVLRKSKTRK